MHFRPLSLNDAKLEEERSLSPINLITNKRDIYRKAIIEKNTILKNLMKTIKEQLTKQK
jgi:hypothetical protein